MVMTYRLWESLENMKKLIDKCINDPVYKQGREKARKEGWAYPGESAKRAADYLIQKKCFFADKE